MKKIKTLVESWNFFFQWVPAETSAGLTRVMGESTNSVAYMQPTQRLEGVLTQRCDLKKGGMVVE